MAHDVGDATAAREFLAHAPTHVSYLLGLLQALPLALSYLLGLLQALLDGQNHDLVNYWRRLNIGAGDQLIFRLVHQSFPGNVTTLSNRPLV